MNSYHVLLITTSYSDKKLTASQRAYSFAKHLPLRGIRISVLTTTDKIFHKQIGKFDETIYRIPSPFLWIEKLVSIVLKLVSKKSRENSGKLKSTIPYQSDKWYKRPFNIPDLHWAWSFLAYIHAIKINDQKKVDVILSTSPAESTHIVAHLVKKKLKIPWIADLRDGWMFEPYKIVRLRQGLRQKLELFLEKNLLRQADTITVVTRPICTDLVSRVGIPRNRIYLIPNGYDPDEWQIPLQSVKEARRQLDKFEKSLVILHMGRLSSASIDRHSDEFFKALVKLRENQLSIYKSMKFIFYGAESENESLLAKELKLSDIVNFRSRVPKKEAVSMMLAADGLLLITSAKQKSIATSKLFDYMAARKPVFALAKGNVAEEIIKKTGIGISSSSLDSDDIYEKLISFYSFMKIKNLSDTFRTSEIKKYERGPQAARLADIIYDNVLKHSRIKSSRFNKNL